MVEIMKIVLLGCGSIGKRHLNNLRQRRPDARVVRADPALLTDRSAEVYADWRQALDENQDAAGVIVASPTDCHADQLDAILARGLPAYVEKPLTTIADWTPTRREALRHYAPGARVAIGFQYRFAVDPARTVGALDFYARDDLIERYGLTCLETMGSHAIDLALWALGPATRVTVRSDGRSFTGGIEHEYGTSRYDMRIDAGPRASTINGEPNNIDNGVYMASLSAWLDWLETGRHSERTATIEAGAAVMDVMQQCRQLTFTN
jgi:predicted dehydrogenase